MIHFSIVVPAYNEGHHLEGVIRRLHEAVRVSEPSFEIVLVNNGSTDNTVELVSSLEQTIPELRVVHVYPNQGYGNGVLRGLAAAQGSILGWIHADEQAQPEHLLKIYQTIKVQGYDVGKAVRIQRDESRWRIFQSRVYNFLFRFLFGMSYRDINGTPKLMNRAFYEKASLSSKEWFIDPEFMIRAKDIGARIGEVEIVWEARRGGKSKVHLMTMFHFLRHMLRYRYRKDVSV